MEAGLLVTGMEYTTLGSTGMKVSKICLGCASFGSKDWKPWVVEEEESRKIIEKAIDHGVNFFDTANSYSIGESERILGNVLTDYDRDWSVVASKVFNRMDEDNPNAVGLSRKGIEQELSNTLDRLGMETLDLYQIHRWDYQTPIEETLRTLDDAVRRNQVRYIGASSMYTYQFASALWESDHHDLEQFATMQSHYNLLYREEEREMLPLCDQEGIGVTCYSPLARGHLARPFESFTETSRGRYTENRDDHMQNRIEQYRAGGGEEINKRVRELADEKGASMAQISLAWLLSKNWVDTPIIGTTSVEHLEDAIDAIDINLSSSDVEYLEEPYQPVKVVGQAMEGRKDYVG